MARSGAPSVPRSFAVSSLTESSRLCFSLSRADALLGRAGLAEHPLEGHARVDADRQRARVVAPGERVEERAGEAVAGADGGAHVLGADLDRSQRRVVGDHVGDVLIERLLRLDLAEGVARALAAADRADAVQERRAGAEVHRCAPRRLHLADRDKLIAERLERLHDRLELEVGAGVVRMPGVGIHAVRHVDRAEPERRARPPFAPAPSSAGTIASSSGSAIAAPNVPRRNVRRDRCFFVMIMATAPSLVRPLLDWFGRLQPRPHLERRALDDAVNDRREAVVVLRRLLHDAPDDRHIGRLEAAAQRVGQHPLGQHGDEGFGRLRIASRSATGPSTFVPSASTPAASIGAPFVIVVAPLPDRVEVLEREARRDR